MKHRLVVMGAIVTVAVAALAGCGSSSKKSSSTPGTTSASSASTVKKAPPKLRLVQNKKLGEKIIVNPVGRTVYMYAPDGSATTSKVPAALKVAWPRVLASGNLTVGSGLDKSKIAKHAQPNGKQQVSYNGHLVYTFTGDKKSGDANGQGLGGIWFALNASGDKAS